MSSDARPSSRRIEVEKDLIARMLSPFKPACRYLESATLTVSEEPQVKGSAAWVLRGAFAIPESCYINDTGHLNSIEFNICSNQLLQVALAQALESRLAPELSDLTLEELVSEQRPETVIRELNSVFKRVINARRFEGEVTVDGPLRRGSPFEVGAHFWDANDGFAEGAFTVVLHQRSRPTS